MSKNIFHLYITIVVGDMMGVTSAAQNHLENSSPQEDSQNYKFHIFAGTNLLLKRELCVYALEFTHLLQGANVVD